MPWINEMFNYTEDGFLEYYIIEGINDCHALGKRAFIDSSLSCWLFQLPFLLENFGFGYFCLALIIPIMLISIFGKIKQSYRWFILNQAFWDFFIIYNFICDKPTWNTWFKDGFIGGWFTWKNRSREDWLKHTGLSHPTCFYSSIYDSNNNMDYFNYIIATVFRYAATNASYAPLFLLTLSRFLSIYFNHSYVRLFTPIKTQVIIVVFNLICITLVNIEDLYKVFAQILLKESYEKCVEEECKDYDADDPCWYNECRVKYFYIVNNIYLQVIKTLLPVLLLILSNIFASSLIFKLCRRFKFQLKSSRIHFISSLRISSVILFQCFTMTFLFIISFLQTYFSTLIKIFHYFHHDIIDLWPSWVRFITLDSTIQSFNIIRMFLDSFIVLSVLPEYRKIFVDSVIAFISILIHPKRFLKQLKAKIFNQTFAVKIIPKNFGNLL